MIKIETIKVKYIGPKPIVHAGGRLFEPGKKYELTYEQWVSVQGNGTFEELKSKITKSKRGRKKSKPVEELKEVEPEPILVLDEKKEVTEDGGM